MFRNSGGTRWRCSHLSFPGHGSTVVAEGYPVFKDHGVPVAFHGHRCACCCVLLTPLPGATAS
ncbi:PAAR domain-containing protein [Pseudomonas solani]|uniref:PAAR domain-containing protein n=1 Tax=Pseudomonas solani TaxID=2731552 RepID=UPI00353176E3